MVPTLIKPVLSLEFALSVTSDPSVKALSVKAVLVVLIVPFRVTVLGAVVTTPSPYKLALLWVQRSPAPPSVALAP